MIKPSKQVNLGPVPPQALDSKYSHLPRNYIAHTRPVSGLAKFPFLPSQSYPVALKMGACIKKQAIRLPLRGQLRLSKPFIYKARFLIPV